MHLISSMGWEDEMFVKLAMYIRDHQAGLSQFWSLSSDFLLLQYLLGIHHISSCTSCNPQPQLHEEPSASVLKGWRTFGGTACTITSTTNIKSKPNGDTLVRLNQNTAQFLAKLKTFWREWLLRLTDILSITRMNAQNHLILSTHSFDIVWDFKLQVYIISW